MDDNLEKIIKAGNDKESQKEQKELLKLYIEGINKKMDIEDINIQKNNTILQYLLDKDNIKKINPDNYIFENGKIHHIIGLNLIGDTLLFIKAGDLFKDKKKPKLIKK